MNAPKPAVVTQRSARRLPRVPLLLLCAAYLLPGLFGRDPWRGADMAAFGQMVAIAEGRTSWLAPTLGGLPADSALLPHWLGAAFIAAGQGWLEPALAARVPFVLLLGATLALVWYTTFHLARTEAAQPVAFAFGGEAQPVDYARAIADGAVLALMATLGLLQLGHETTPELAQLASVAMFAYGLSAAPFYRWRARVAVVGALTLLAGSGAPAVAVIAAVGGSIVCRGSRYPAVRAFTTWVVAAGAAATLVAAALGTWHWRVVEWAEGDLRAIARQWLWFLWPAWPLALWTLWRWRRQLSYRHLSVPLVGAAAGLLANLAMAGSDRALMLALPGLAVLAAFALPTLSRSASAGVDWFSMCFFTLCAITIWVVYASLQVGVPAQPALNVARLAPGYVSSFSALALLFAAAGTAAWLWLVRWRTGRHRDALWKSLVLPAGGVALCWLLLMTLWLPLLDYGRSARPLITRLQPHVPAGDCIAAPGVSISTIAALEHLGRWRVDARSDGAASACRVLLRVVRDTALPEPPPGWALVAKLQRPTDRQEFTLVYHRIADRPTP